MLPIASGAAVLWEKEQVGMRGHRGHRRVSRRESIYGRGETVVAKESLLIRITRRKSPRQWKENNNQQHT